MQRDETRSWFRSKRAGFADLVQAAALTKQRAAVRQWSGGVLLQRICKP